MPDMLSIGFLSLTGLLCMIAAGLAYRGYRYKKEWQLTTDELVEEAHKLINAMRKNPLHGNDEAASVIPTDFDDPSELRTFLKSPEYLTTLCTVLVKKAGGEVRLNQGDFEPITSNDYISVFVDTKDSSLLLRLNSIVDYFPDDDNTYH